MSLSHLINGHLRAVPYADDQENEQYKEAQVKQWEIALKKNGIRLKFNDSNKIQLEFSNPRQFHQFLEALVTIRSTVNVPRGPVLVAHLFITEASYVTKISYQKGK